MIANDHVLKTWTKHDTHWYACKISVYMRLRVYVRDNFTCVHCRQKFRKSYLPLPEKQHGQPLIKALSLDHIVPIRDMRGMAPAIVNAYTNLRTACKNCNTQRGLRWK